MYEWLKYAYPLSMATLEQFEKAVVKGKLTVEQFKEITGQEYPVTEE